MAAYYADNDVLKLLIDSLGTELANRGFILATGPNVIALELTKFSNIVLWDSLLGHSVSRVEFLVEVKDQAGAELFKKNISELHSESSFGFLESSYVRVSLEAALRDAIGKVVADPEFIATLIVAPK